MKCVNSITVLILSVLLWPLAGISPVFAQAGDFSLPNVTPTYIMRRSYSDLPSTVVNQRHRLTSTTGGSFLASNSTGAILSGIGGVLSVAGGGIFTWVQITKKKRNFKDFLKKIDAAVETYLLDKKDPSKEKNKLLNDLKEYFKKLQDDAELAMTNKALDQDHVTVIEHHIQSKLEALK